MARTTYARHDDDHDDDDRALDDEGTSPTRAGTAVCLATGISITLLGLALIVLRTQGFDEKVDSLTALGLGPGVFLATGLVIVVAAFVLREIGHLGLRVEDVYDTADELFEMVEETTEQGATTGDERQVLLRSFKTALEEKTKGTARDVHQVLEQVANLEMELNGASESLRSITNRLDTLRRQSEEGFAALQASVTPDEAAQTERAERERRLGDRLDALERSVHEAVATVRAIESLCIPLPEHMQTLNETTDGKFEALIASLDGMRSQGDSPDETETLAQLLERLDRIEPAIQGDADLTRAVQQELQALRPAVERAGADTQSDPRVEAHLANLQRLCEAIQTGVQQIAQRPVPVAAGAAPAATTATPTATADKPQGASSAVMDSIAKLRSMRG